MINLNYEYTVEDYLQAMRLHMRLRSWQKYLLIAIVSLSLVRIIPLMTGASLGDVIQALMPLGLFGIACVVIYVVLPRQKVKRTFSQQKSLQRAYKTVVSPDTITTTSELGQVAMPISDYHQYKVGKDCLLLYTSQSLFNMFPRRFFASDEEFDTFIAYLELHLGQPKR